MKSKMENIAIEHGDRLKVDDFETKELKFFSYEQLPDDIPNSHRIMLNKYYNNFEG
ncbi:hypothetical protein [Clostridium sp.]|uniref:hypothetical protein n=1 Tax=Clostridium sp. TaxID=1506 RepID=UPI00346431F0